MVRSSAARTIERTGEAETAPIPAPIPAPRRTLRPLDDARRLEVGATARAAVAFLAGRAAGIRTPLVADLELTHRCNLRCVYCDKWSTGGERELSLAEWLAVVDDLVAMGARWISFDGGEALRRDDAVRIVRHAIDAGARVNLNTNGLLFPGAVGDLRGLASIKVSVDGPAPVHDRLRGRGAFAAAIRAVEAAESAGVAASLTCVLNGENLGEVDSLLALARDLGTPVGFQPADAILVGSARHRRWAPPVAEYRAVIDRLIRMRPAHAEIANSIVGLRHLRRWPEPVRLPCAGGILMVNVAPEGDVYVCGRMQGLEPRINLRGIGMREAMRRLDPSGCDRCWCKGYSEMNLLYSLSPALAVREVWPRLHAG